MRTKTLFDELALVFDALDRAFDGGRNLSVHAPSVSAWSVGEQLQHVAQANAMCLGAVHAVLEGTDERLVVKGKPTLPGRMVLRAGVIPRGRAKAPAGTEPPDDVDADLLSGELERGRRRLEALGRRRDEITAATLRYPHPILGPFSAQDWLRFTAVHTRHHLAIVRDIRNAA